MTLKQFGELAGGASLAYLFYASNWHPLLKIPLAFFFGIMGISLAFLPIEERPLDIWIINFLRAIYHPTYYIWKKDSVFSALALASSPPHSSSPPEEIPSSAAPGLWPFPKPAPETTPSTEPTPTVEPSPPPTPIPLSEPEPKKTEPVLPPTPPTPSLAEPPPLSVDQLLKLRGQKAKTSSSENPESPFSSSLVPPLPPSKETFPLPNSAAGLTIDDLASLREKKATEKETRTKNNLSEMDQKITTLSAQNKEFLIQIENLHNQILSRPGQDNHSLEEQTTSLTEQKNTLSAQISKLRQDMQTERVAPLSSPAYQPTMDKSANFRVVSKAATRQATVTLTELPNIMNGIITDDKGTPIDSVILVIKDKTGNSIRAMKSNKIGQFMVSTPLENGLYYLEMEKPGLIFDPIEINLTGQVLQPLYIKPKQQAGLNMP